MHLTRGIAALAAAAAIASGFAAPAVASPQDGEGCVGFPAVPATYVCVISVTPGGAVPTTSTTSIPVTVPRFCYAVDCVGPTTVNVPVPGVTPGSGVVATLWYGGTYYPIGVGTVPGVSGVPGTGGLYDTVVWLPFELAFGSREAWVEYRDNTYDGICNDMDGKVCL